MAMLDRSRTQKIIRSTSLLVLGAASVIFLIIVIRTASNLSGSTDSMLTRTVSIAGIDLMELSKTPVQNGGYQASVQYLPGILIYAALMLVSVLALSFWRVRRQNIGDVPRRTNPAV
jgi:hypothetical protein